VAEIFRVAASKILREWIPEWVRGIKLGDAGRKRANVAVAPAQLLLAGTRRRGVGARGRAHILLRFHKRENIEKSSFQRITK